MSVEAAEKVTDQPRKQTFSELDSSVTSGINSLMNEQVGYGIRSAAAAKKVDQLFAVNKVMEAADALRQGAPLTEEQSELIAGESFEALMDRARGMYAEYELMTSPEFEKPSFQTELESARKQYVELAFNRPKLFGHKEHDLKLSEAENRYNAAFASKITAILHMDPNDPKAPYAPPTMEALSDTELSLETLSGNQLHVLVDQLAREQLNKAEIIENMSGKGAKRVLRALEDNRALRIAIGGALWAGSLAAQNKGLLPGGTEFIGDAAAVAMPVITGYFTSRELLHGIDNGIDKMLRRRQQKRDIAAMSESVVTTDRALRAIYSDIEYQDGAILDRGATTTVEGNKEQFSKIDDQFGLLRREEYRGGKPYDADRVIPYVADMLLNHGDDLRNVVDSMTPNEAFAKLALQVIEADTAKFTEEQKQSRVKRIVFRALSLGVAVFAKGYVDFADGVNSIAKKPTKMLKGELGI